MATVVAKLARTPIDTVQSVAYSADANLLDGVDSTGFATAAHNHSGVYSPVAHDHAGVYSPVAHDHALVYSAIGHDHSGVYSPVAHDHALVYAAIGHDHAGVYSPVAHDHAGVYSVVAHDHAGVYCRWRGSSSGEPADPAAGDLWIDTDDSKVYFYNGAAWVALS